MNTMNTMNAAHTGNTSASNVQENNTSAHDFLADRIIHYLTIYPVISPTMLQAALGPGCSPKLWRPVLVELINQGDIEQTEVTTTAPTGRQNTYTQIQLSKTKQKELQSVLQAAV